MGTGEGALVVWLIFFEDSWEQQDWRGLMEGLWQWGALSSKEGLLEGFSHRSGPRIRGWKKIRPKRNVSLEHRSVKGCLVVLLWESRKWLSGILAVCGTVLSFSVRSHLVLVFFPLLAYDEGTTRARRLELLAQVHVSYHFGSSQGPLKGRGWGPQLIGEKAEGQANEQVCHCLQYYEKKN